MDKSSALSGYPLGKFPVGYKFKIYFLYVIMSNNTA